MEQVVNSPLGRGWDWVSKLIAYFNSYNYLKYLPLAVICILCFSNAISAQTPKITASLDRYEIEVGEQVKLQLVAEYASEVDVQFPLLKLDNEQVEIAEIADIDSTRLENGLIRKLQVIMVQAWDTGQYVIPALSFYYKNVQKNSNSKVTTEALTFFVKSPLENALPTPNPQDSAAVAGAEIRDIKDIKEMPFTWQDAVPYVLMGLVLLLILGGLFYWWRKRKQKLATATAYIPPPRPAHEIAIEKLRGLEDAKYWQQGEVKKYYSELTNIVREYLEGRYSILALESTTEEILQDLQQKDFDTELWKKLKEMLQTADLVKFAKAKPSIEKHAQYLTDAKEVVRITKKTIAVTEEEAAVANKNQN
ncbi:MAG: BatD family protein [Chitinophagales bacterium]